MIPPKVIYFTLSLFFFLYLTIQKFPQREILLEVFDSKHQSTYTDVQRYTLKETKICHQKKIHHFGILIILNGRHLRNSRCSDTLTLLFPLSQAFPSTDDLIYINHPSSKAHETAILTLYLKNSWAGMIN